MPEHRRMKRTLLLLVAVVLGAAVASGCGSSGGTPAASTATSSTATSPSASTATSTTEMTTTTITPTTTSATTTTSTSSTTSASASGGPPCRAAALSLSFLGQQGGLGHGEIGFVLKNTSGASCRTYGYPGILFLDQGGHPLPTIPHHTTNDFFGSSPAVPLVIAPGGSASFRLDVGHGVATSAGCATAYALQVIPPNDTATLRTAIPNGAYECKDANVSPLRAGTAAYP
jgi:ABC-type transport system substrate-binding protein